MYKSKCNDTIFYYSSKLKQYQQSLPIRQNMYDCSNFADCCKWIWKKKCVIHFTKVRRCHIYDTHTLGNRNNINTISRKLPIFKIVRCYIILEKIKAEKWNFAIIIPNSYFKARLKSVSRRIHLLTSMDLM